MKIYSTIGSESKNKEEAEKDLKISATAEKLMEIIAGNLEFKDGFDNSIVDLLLDRVLVYKTDDKNLINLKVYFKVLTEERNYRVTREKRLRFVTNNTYDYGQYRDRGFSSPWR